MQYASCISELVKISVCLVESWWCPGQCPRDALRVNKSAFRNLISHHTNHENQSHRNSTVISQITKRDRTEIVRTTERNRTDTVRTTGRNRTETVRTTDRNRTEVRTNHGPKSNPKSVPKYGSSPSEFTGQVVLAGRLKNFHIWSSGLKSLGL